MLHFSFSSFFVLTEIWRCRATMITRRVSPSVYRGFRAFVFLAACLRIERLFDDEKRINERAVCTPEILNIDKYSSVRPWLRCLYPLCRVDPIVWKTVRGEFLRACAPLPPVFSQPLETRREPSNCFSNDFSNSYSDSIITHVYYSRKRERNLYTLTFEITFFQLSRLLTESVALFQTWSITCNFYSLTFSCSRD